MSGTKKGPQRRAVNRFERGAYHMLGMFACQRVQWGGKDEEPSCAELPGTPAMCALCWFRQAVGLRPVTRRDLVRYMERER